MTDHFEDWLTRHEVEPLAPRPDTYPRVARSARRRRTVRVAGTAAAVSVVLVATAGGVFRLAHPPRPVGPPAATPTGSAAPQPGPSPSSAPPTPSGAGSSSPAGTDATRPVSGRCRTGEVRVTVQPAPGGGAGGSVWRWLIFTNTSDRTCTLYGFPGVSYVTGASGAQINDPADRDTLSTPVRVSLTPGQGAPAAVRTGHWQAYPDTCQPVQAAGYRVYVPDETDAVFVSSPMTVCSTDGVNGMLVRPVSPGVTE